MGATLEMEPLWIFLPGIPRYSLGWRMGQGEDYKREWWPWFRSLNNEQRELYINKYPEPPEWRGFYTNEHPSLPEEIQNGLRKGHNNI